jgi:hypothetical protein
MGTILVVFGNGGRSNLDMANRSLFRNGSFEAVAEKV